MNNFDIINVPEDTLDRLLMGKATDGDQLLAHNAIKAALSTLQSGAEGKDANYWQEMHRAANKRADGMEQILAQAYQVVGSLLCDVGAFDTPEAEKILDNLSRQKLVHADVIPWPSFGDGHIASLEIDASRYRGLKERDWFDPASQPSELALAFSRLCGSSLDAAVDTALQPGQGTEK